MNCYDREHEVKIESSTIHEKSALHRNRAYVARASQPAVADVRWYRADVLCVSTPSRNANTARGHHKVVSATWRGPKRLDWGQIKH